MSLSDRLRDAARHRDDPTPTPTPPPAVARRRPAPPAPAPGRVRIVAAPTDPVLAADPDPAAAPDAVCPTCRRTGELGVVDLVGRTADWSCAACGTLWQAILPAPADPAA